VLTGTNESMKPDRIARLQLAIGDFLRLDFLLSISIVK
jgi:hypothetical protein